MKKLILQDSVWQLPVQSPSPCVSFTQSHTDIHLHSQSTYVRGWGVRLICCYHVGPFFFLVPASFLAYSTFMPENWTATSRRSCTTAGLACAKFTTGVSGISIFASKTDRQPRGPKSGLSRIQVFFFLGSTLDWQHYPLIQKSSTSVGFSI